MKPSTKLVKLTYSMAQVKQSIGLVDHIVEELGNYDKVATLKMDVEFVVYICNKIENEIDKSDRTDDKAMFFWITSGRFMRNSSGI